MFSSLLYTSIQSLSWSGYLDNLGFLGSLLCIWMSQPSIGVLIELFHGLLVSRISPLNFTRSSNLMPSPMGATTSG